MNAIWIALIVAAPTALGPVLLVRAQGRERRRDQRLTWDRDDAVALKVAETARLLEENNRAVVANAQRMDVKLNEIHILVNSTLTAAMDSELAALKQQLLLMREANKPAGVIADVEGRVNLLQSKLASRAVQTSIADDVAHLE